MTKREDQDLGFSVAGGKENPLNPDNNEAIFVSRIVEGGMAEISGLMVKDELLSVRLNFLILFVKTVNFSSVIRFLAHLLFNYYFNIVDNNR